MAVIISLFLALISLLYALFISLPLLYNAKQFQLLHSIVEQYPLKSSGLLLVLSLLSLIISLWGMFRYRNSTMVVGSKKFLLLIAIIALIVSIDLMWYILRFAISILEFGTA